MQQRAFKTSSQVLAFPSVVCCGSFLRDTQCGGIRSRGVDMASLLLRSYLARTSALKRTALVVFYDVKTAFCAVIRQMLLPVPPSREEYLDMLDSVDIPLPLVPILR